MSSTEKNKKKLLRYDQVIAKEDEHLKERRKKLRGEKEMNELEDTRFGIAMSGGGIRSATINLGLLRTLNKFNILEKADYLSTVSGGGYTGSYIQATLKNEQAKNEDSSGYDNLFQDKHIDYMRSRGMYMVPGTRLEKLANTLVLIVGYVMSTAMSWMGPAIVIFLGVSVFATLGEITDTDLVTPIQNFLKEEIVWGLDLMKIGFVFFIGVYAVHFIFNLYHEFGLGISRFFNRLESGLAMLGILAFSFLLISKIISIDLVLFENLDPMFKLILYLIFAILIITLGFFTNPNSTSFHRFYRNQLADAYLNFTGDYKNVQMRNLFNGLSDKKKDYISPYPLINTCLNLQAMGGGDANFKGAKASDYFLLSPLYFGSKLTKYISTNDFWDYRRMTLPAATTISAAAVNPGMGMYSNKILSVLMTIFNARLGFWISNPLRSNAREWVWWPTYFFRELFSQIGTANKKLNISDGGHIENLAVYELLRRRCRLIIAVDAGADATYSFTDLENLTVRARNELGLEIEFREGQVPEDTIRPKPSHGYSRNRFAVADIYQIWDEIPSITKEGKVIKDQNNKLFEVIVNYSDLKESIKSLDFNGRLLVRMIFRVITEFKASDELQTQLGHLNIDNEVKVKALLNMEIFSGGTNARTESITKVLKEAIYKEPDNMKRLLKKVKLLDYRYDNDIKLDEALIEDIAENKLQGKIGDIEQAIVDELNSKEIKNAYSVMVTFLDLLAGIKVGIENKLTREFILRKVEDEFLIKVLIKKGFSEKETREMFNAELDDDELTAWFAEVGLKKEVLADLIDERNRIRKFLSKRPTEQELKAKLLELRLDEISEESVLVMNDVSKLLYQNLSDRQLEDELAEIFRASDLNVGLATDLVALRKTQGEKVDALMEIASEKIEEQVKRNIKMGTMVYIKSSVKAPLGKIVTDDFLKYASYKYKIYHPDFPHESTADQFFDPVQWESYYLLGQYLGAEVLGVSGLDNYLENRMPAPNFGIKDLIYRFDNDDMNADLFRYIQEQHLAPRVGAAEGLVEPSIEPLLQKAGRPPMVSEEMSNEVPKGVKEEEVENMEQSVQQKVVAGKKIDYTI